MVYALAHQLGKCIPEIMAMTIQEFTGWVAYFKVTEKRRSMKG